MPKYQRYLIILTLLLTLLVSGSQAQAASPVDFGSEYGFLVHSQNQEKTIPRLKGIQVLQTFFPDSSFEIDQSGPVAFMSQREFLILFERMRLASEGKSSELSDDELYYQTWLYARRQNLLPQTRLTYQALQEFLYRYSVSEKHGGRPYFEGLVLSEDEINVSRFEYLSGVREIKSRLFSEILNIKTLVGVLTKSGRKYLNQISGYYEAFGELENELKALRHPFVQIADMPDDIRQLVTENNLNEVLGSISYNYSRNNANRIHNLVTGAKKMSGKVYQPGEIIDFTEELFSNGIWDYKYGWVIFEGKETWQFGGGLCGSATLAFTPSWKAGLEIIKRYPHSIYYRSLYPEESFGLDATIYRGEKNLVMKNSTNDPILFYVKNDPEAKEVTLYLIGNAPYYSIEIEGPIEVGRNTFKWVRRMEQFDGRIVEDELVTRYGLVY